MILKDFAKNEIADLAWEVIRLRKTHRENCFGTDYEGAEYALYRMCRLFDIRADEVLDFLEMGHHYTDLADMSLKEFGGRFGLRSSYPNWREYYHHNGGADHDRT